MENSLLSRLPAELRNSIYELVLLYDDKVTITKSGGKMLDSECGIASDEVNICDEENRRWRPPAILTCCRQIRQEASPIYYAGSIFVLLWEGEQGGVDPVRRHLRSWLETLEAVDRAQIRRIGFDGG